MLNSAPQRSRSTNSGGRVAMCSARFTAPIVSPIIPTRRSQPVAFFSYTAGLAGPRAGGEMLLPNSWGTSRQRSGGRRGAAPLVSIHP